MPITTDSTRPVRAAAAISKNYVDYQLSDGNISDESDEDSVQLSTPRVKNMKKRARKEANVHN
jgi:hypothetical protein